MDVLRTSPRSKIDELVQPPTDFICVCHGLVLQSFSHDIAFIMKTLQHMRESVRSPQNLSVELEWLDLEISSALLNTQTFAREQQVTKLAEALKVIAEFESLLLQSSKVKYLLEKRMQLLVAALSLMESRKPIQLTDSVRLLTHLAFIFIQLTFSATIFGINAWEFGTGTLPISIFLEVRPMVLERQSSIN